MYQILFLISRIFLYPFELLFSQNSVLQTAWSDSIRTRAFLLGIPALFIAFFGVGILTWAEFGVAKNLEEFYLSEVEKSSKEKNRLNSELRREIRMLQVSQRSDVVRGTDLIPPEDPRRISLKGHQDKESVYLEKLISLNAKEPEYRYKLALSCLEQKKSNRGLAIMNTISPQDEPGHVDGHLFLANYHLNSPATTKREALTNVKKALTHADNCLRRDKTNTDAMQIKAQLLVLLNNHVQAYEIFEKLFEQDPKYYEAMVKINDRLSRQKVNNKVLGEAIGRYDRVLLESERLSDPERVRIWQELTKCYILKGDFEQIEDRLLNEIRLQSADPENTGKRVWLEHLISKAYGAWVSKYPRSNPTSLARRLDLLKKAFRYNPTNELVLRELVRIGANENEEIAAAARRVYDPTAHAEAPPLVLNELGAQALSRTEYELALRYFELARKKAPRVPEILNNLAYTYLVGSNPNPPRALKLVDEAMRFLPNTRENEKYRTHFHDTRGRALMQLNRMSQAAAEFEFALRGRPDNEDILIALIECYRADGLDPSAYERHLETVRQRDSPVQ